MSISNDAGNQAEKMRARRPFVLMAAALTAAFLVAGAFVPASAEHTRFWRQADYDNFERGTAKGVAVNSDSEIPAAPEIYPVAETGIAYLLGPKKDSRADLYTVA